MKRTNDFLKNRSNSEHGFTMVEILVGILLLAGVIAVVTSTLINATQTSDKLTRGTVNQSKILDAVSLITRDISLSKSVEYASSTGLSLKTIEEGVESNVKYFYWDGSANSIPNTPKFADVKNNISLLPQGTPSIIEYRVVGSATSTPIVRSLIEGYNPGANSTSLFLYFDNKNNEILTDNKGVVDSDKLATIRRVQLHISSIIEGREKQMEIQTSASPRFMGIEGNGQAGSNVFIEKTQTPELYGDLIPQTREANIEWTPVAGASGYALYKTNRLENGGVVKKIDELNGDTTSYKDKNVKPGETYEYYVVAHGFAGDSSPSNTIRLRVTPDPTEFVYIQPTRGQDGSDIKGFTVARNLANQISWAPVAGENTQYRLYKITGTTKEAIYTGTATTYRHSGADVTYGATTRYTVVPFNQTITAPTPNRTGVTGGDAPDSPAVTLISPPLAPKITVDVLNDTTSPSRPGAVNKVNIVNDAQNPNAVCYKYFNGGSSSTVTNQINSSTSTVYEHKVAWGSNNYYRSLACNDAGDSPYSTVVGASQIPGPFDINSLVNNEGYIRVRSVDARVETLNTLNKEGQMTASWGKSAGSSTYTVNRSVINTLGGGALPSSFNYNAGISSTTETSARMNRVHPGAVYRVTVIAKAANGKTRDASATLLTKPDVPQTGILESMCAPNGKDRDQDLAMYVSADSFPRYGGADQTTVSYTRKQYGTNNYLSAPGTSTVGINHNLFASQQMRKFEDVKITFQNKFSDASMRQTNPDFGRSASELTSYPLTLETVALADYLGACNTYTGGKVITHSSLSGSWVVPYNICYGYESGKSYQDVWYFPNNLGYGAVFYNDRQNGMIQNSAGGCRWRYAPGITTAPVWESFS